MFDPAVSGLWDRLPSFKRLMDEVPTVHVPMKKAMLAKALNDPGFTVHSPFKPGRYRL